MWRRVFPNPREKYQNFHAERLGRSEVSQFMNEDHDSQDDRHHRRICKETVRSFKILYSPALNLPHLCLRLHLRSE